MALLLLLGEMVVVVMLVYKGGLRNFSDGWIWKVSAIRKVRIHHLAMGYYFDSTDSSTIPSLSWKWMAKKPSLPSVTQSHQTTNPLYKTLHPSPQSPP